MKLIRIKHYRCNEPDGNTYVLAHDEVGDQLIKERIGEAKKKYIELLEAAEANDPKPEGGAYSNSILPRLIKEQPDLTLAQAQEIVDNEIKAYNEWQERKYSTNKKFEDILHELGFIRLWESEEIKEVVVDWYHRHGMSLRYGNEDEIDTIPTPAKIANPSEDDDEIEFL